MTSHNLLRGAIPMLALAAVLVAGCDDDQAPGATAPPAGAVTSPLDAAFPGFYLTPDVGISVEGGNARLATALTCDQLRGMVAAGQWRLADRFALGEQGQGAAGLLNALGQPQGDLLQRGDDLVFADYLDAAGCMSTIREVPRVEVTLKGDDLPGTSKGWVTARCVQHMEPTVEITITFDTEARVGGLLTMQVTKTETGFDLTPELAEDIELILFTHDAGVLNAMSKVFAAGDGPPPKGVGQRETGPGQSFEATITAERTDDGRFSGVLTLNGWASENGTFDLSLPYTCTL